MHVKLHIFVRGLFMQTGRRRGPCLSLIRQAYAFRFSGDRREFILLSSVIPPPYYLGGWPRCMWYPPTRRGAPGDPPFHFLSFRAGENPLGRGVKPVRIPIDCSVLFLSNFRDFSDFGYNFRRIPKLYYL